MGVPKFYRWISERYPCLSQVLKEHQVRSGARRTLSLATFRGSAERVSPQRASPPAFALPGRGCWSGRVSLPSRPPPWRDPAWGCLRGRGQASRRRCERLRAYEADPVSANPLLRLGFLGQGGSYGELRV